MLVPFLIFAQLALPADSIYSSAGVRALVTQAVVENHAPPPAFRGYRAHVETELSMLLRDTLGRERAGQIEELASSAQWTRGGAYAMHVVGYRSQGLGIPFSALSIIRGWTEPSLYGERLRLGAMFGGDSAPRPRSPRDSADTIIVVHPFAADRERYYRYSGGDTVTVLRAGTRAIAIVRVRVSPHLPDSTRLAAFDGEIDLDAGRHQIVRMRGRFVVLGRAGRRPLLARMGTLVGVAYGEFVNTEVNGQYWLPATQHTEMQASLAVLGRARSIVRIVSRFSDYSVDDTSAKPGIVDDSRRIAHETTWAPSDSVSGYTEWRMSLGDLTTSVTADDFADLAPDAWRTTGAPRVDFIPSNTDNLVRYDRVEGLYTGVQANVLMRSVVPGLSMGAKGGVAWTERTVRGGANVALNRDAWTFGVRAERMLATTNDFIPPFYPQTGGLAALLGSTDDFDYVDRRVAVGSLSRVIGSLRDALVTVQAGVGDDRAEVSRLSHGVFGGGSFRPNRNATSGRYALGVIDAELHPGLSGDFVQPGIGASLHYEEAHGSLQWRRVELSTSGQRYWGPFALFVQGDAGAVFGAFMPPQALFELGGVATLPGYGYKEFGGDRAALFRSYVSYALPLWRAPHRLRGNWFMPGVAPGMAAGFQGGWTELSTDASRAAVQQLGAGWSPVPVSRATDGIRATVGAGFTLFSGFVHFGVVRPVDRPAPWKLSLGVGPAF
jgi:hypothetical protein